MPDDLIFFLHIPRTMGTLLKGKCLAPNFYPEQVIFDLTVDNALLAPPGRFDGVKLLCGHVGYNLTSAVNICPHWQITMLRDPIYRARSMYEFCRKADWFYLHKQSMRMSLVEFTTCPETAAVIANAQARQLTDDRPYQEVACDSTDRSEIDRRLYNPPCLDESELLKRAFSRLEEFDFVGIADRFYESLQLLWRILGIKQPKLDPDAARQMHPYLKSNSYQLTTAEYEALRAINRVDELIYHQAEYKLNQLIWRAK